MSLVPESQFVAMVNEWRQLHQFLLYCHQHATELLVEVESASLKLSFVATNHVWQANFYIESQYFDSYDVHRTARFFVLTRDIAQIMRMSYVDDVLTLTLHSNGKFEFELDGYKRHISQMIETKTQ